MAIRRAILWLVLVVLVSGQTLGLVHRVVHDSSLGASVSAAPLTAASISGASAQADEPVATRGWASDLFNTHDDDSCRVFDQLGHGGLLPGVPAINLPLLLPFLVLLWFQGEAIARWAALFDARGPPTLR